MRRFSWKERLLLFLAPLVGVLIIRMLRRVMVIEYRGREIVHQNLARGENVLYTFWHDQLLMMHYAYFGSGISTLISEHRDGEMLARTLRRLGHSVIRGSTTSGGARALRNMVRCARNGFDLAIAPDGPRGPRHQAQSGAVELARLSSLRIIPVAFGVSKKKLCAPGIAFRSRCLSAGVSSYSANRLKFHAMPTSLSVNV